MKEERGEGEEMVAGGYFTAATVYHKKPDVDFNGVKEGGGKRRESSMAISEAHTYLSLTNGQVQ